MKRPAARTNKRLMRRQIEVYFILYLAAILFLLPNKREKAPTSDPNLALELISSRFFIAPERLTLNCQILTTGSTTNVIQLDSVNTITYSGDYTDVHYEFFVEDISLRQTVVAMSARQAIAGSFRMEEDSRRGAVLFYWKPDTRDRRNRTFTVRVVATGRPNVPASITEPDLRSRLQRIINDASRVDTAQTTFTINVINSGLGIGTGDTLLASQTLASTGANVVVANVRGAPVAFRLPPDFRPPPAGEFALLPQQPSLSTLPFQKWSNIVLVSQMNLQREQRGSPQVEVFKSDPNDEKGGAFITETLDNTFRMSGTAPASGVMNVRVTITRAEDGKRATTEFVVKASPLQPPDIPQRMNPGISYKFTPNLDFLTGQDLRASVSERGGTERYSSPQGSAFIFTPAESDAGKTLLFSRFINGQRVGEVYSIAVEDFPLPEILTVVQEGAKLIVRTRCFGTVGGRENRVTIDVSKATNAQVSERYGDIYRSDDRQEYSQLFELRRVDATKPITGSIRAVDAKNKFSAMKSVER
jgi:hypothetical protein